MIVILFVELYTMNWPTVHVKKLYLYETHQVILICGRSENKKKLHLGCVDFPVLLLFDWNSWFVCIK